MRTLLSALCLFLAASLSAKESLVLLADGLDQKAVATKATSAIDKIDGAKVTRITAKTIDIEFDPAKTREADLKKSLAASGLKITGQKAFFKIKGLVCSSCSNTLIRLLAKEEGVVYVNSISHLTGQADVSFDPQKTNQAKIEAAVNATRYQVIKTPPSS